MYQPQVPLIRMSPAFRTVKLAAVGLGRLVLLRAAGDLPASPGLGLRADALSAQGDLTEGALRLGDPIRFERGALEESVVAVEIDYLLEADLASVARRTPTSGDLVLAAHRPGAAGIYVANLWRGTAGVLDIASAVIRPFAGRADTVEIVFSWKLVEREHRSRTLFERTVSEPAVQERPRRVYGEDCD